MSDGVFIQFVCQSFKLMVIQIKICHRFVCIIFVDSPHSSNGDHVKLDFSICLSVRLAITVLLSTVLLSTHQEPVSGQACNPLDPH